MIVLKPLNNSFRFITWYINNLPEDPLRPLYCNNCTTEIGKIKGHIVTIANENTPLAVTTSKHNQAYLMLKCKRCKTYYVLIIYTPNA
jgi:hypothetical protein